MPGRYGTGGAEHRKREYGGNGEDTHAPARGDVVIEVDFLRPVRRNVEVGIRMHFRMSPGIVSLLRKGGVIGYGHRRRVVSRMRFVGRGRHVVIFMRILLRLVGWMRISCRRTAEFAERIVLANQSRKFGKRVAAAGGGTFRGRSRG